MDPLADSLADHPLPSQVPYEELIGLVFTKAVDVNVNVAFDNISSSSNLSGSASGSESDSDSEDPMASDAAGLPKPSTGKFKPYHTCSHGMIGT